MLIRVRTGKGQKDRYAKLSARLLAVLRDYYSKYRPNDLLFRRRTGGPMTGLDFSRATATPHLSNYNSPNDLMHRWQYPSTSPPPPRQQGSRPHRQ